MRLELIVTRGLPGSGKSTAARAWVEEIPTRRARVNRDDLRIMLHGRRFGEKWQEDAVTVIQLEAIAALLDRQTSVIVDDTNLDPEHLDEITAIATRRGIRVRVWDLTWVPVDTCIARDAGRTGADRVGEDVIRRLRARWLTDSAGRTPRTRRVGDNSAHMRGGNTPASG